MHIYQQRILWALCNIKSLTFSQLFEKIKDERITSDLFNFHLKQVIRMKYVKKESALYLLTTKGKEYVGRFDSVENKIEKQGKITCIVVVSRIRDKRREYMTHIRQKHPFFGKLCFLTEKTRFGESVYDTARRGLREEAALTGDPILKGIFHKLEIDSEGIVVEDKHFYILHVASPKRIPDLMGECEQIWMTVTELERRRDDTFSSAFEVLKCVQKKQVMFWEKWYPAAGF